MRTAESARRSSLRAPLVVVPAALLAAVLGQACGAEPSAAPAPAAVTASDAAPAVAAALRADDSLRAAYAGADDRPLLGVLEGAALVAARRDLAAMAARGARREERLLSRRVVHASRQGPDAEVVIELHAQERLLAGPGSPPFADVLRQWRARLRAGAAGWEVTQAADLRPDQWWPASQGASVPGG